MAWPTTDDPKTNFVTIRFTDGESASIDASRHKAHQTRSAYIRDCVRRVQQAEDRKAARLKGKQVDS